MATSTRPAVTVRQLAPGELACQVNPKTFAAAVASVAKCIPSKPTHPIMAGIKLETLDGELLVSASDYDTSMSVSVDAHGANEGTALVSGRLLANIAKTLPIKPVYLRSEGSAVTLRCGSVRLSMPMMTVDDYPSLPEPPATVATIAADALATLVERVAVAGDASNTFGLPVLSGVRLLPEGDRVLAIATDRFRVAIGRVGWAPKTDILPAALVPIRPLVDAVKAMRDDSVVAIGIDRGNFSLTTSKRSVVVRQLEAREFPSAIAKQYTDPLDSPARVPAADLIAAVKRTTLLQSDRLTGMIELAFDAKGYCVRSDDRDATGEGTGTELAELVDVDHGGPTVSIHIRPHWLIDAIEALGTDLVDISITDPKRGVLITSPDIPVDEIRHVVMPIRKAS